MTNGLAIVGSGLAGSTLAALTPDSLCFDKGRGPGGRCSTRRTSLGSFDHGAQYFTTRDEEFTRLVRDWESQGYVARWNGITGRFVARDFRPSEARDPRWVGTPGMSALVRAAQIGLNLQFERRISSLQRKDKGWLLDGEGPFDRVVLTLPAPQALELLPEGSALTKPLQSVTYDPCLVAMVTMREASGLPFASATVEDPTDGLAWMANESSKPGRLATPERWVLHSDPAWARAHLEEDPLESARALCEAFRARTGAGEALEVLGHRWRYARVRDHLPEGQDFLWDESEQLGWVGDGAIGPRIESAYLSGRALARRLAR